jgi:hypothetical protein
VVDVHKTKVVFVAAGTVNDYGATQKANLAQKFADIAKVEVSAVEILVEAASVRITSLITTDDAAAASSLTSTISSALADPTLASTALGITVESTPTVEAVVEKVVKGPELDGDAAAQKATDGGNGGAVAGIVAIIAVSVIVLGGIIGFVVFKKKAAFVTHQPAAKMGAPTPMEMRPNTPKAGIQKKGDFDNIQLANV